VVLADEHQRLITELDFDGLAGDDVDVDALMSDRLVIPASGGELDDSDVRDLRLSDQR